MTETIVQAPNMVGILVKRLTPTQTESGVVYNEQIELSWYHDDTSCSSGDELKHRAINADGVCAACNQEIRNFQANILQVTKALLAEQMGSSNASFGSWKR